jgi:NAD-dependent deacetylase
VVWFGEPIHPQVARAASRIAAGADVFLTIGTSAVVYPAAGLVQEAARRGAFTAEINIEPTPAAAIVDLTVVGPAEVILDRVETLVANQA